MKSVIYIIFLIIITSCSNKEKLVSPVKFNGKYGYVDTNGKWFVEPKFDSVGIFYNGYADFYSNGKSGLINSNGNIIISAKYDFIGNVENDLALVEINNRYNYSDLEGNLISESDFYDVGDFSENLVSVKYNQDAKWGYINNLGEKQIDTIYDYADTFENGNGLVDFGELELLIDKNGKVIDTVISPRLTYKKYRVIGNAANGTLGKVNLKGDTIMSIKYSSFGYVQKDKFWFKENNKFGIADTIGNILIKPLYEDLSYFSDNGLARAKKDGKYGFINEKGTVIIEFKFEDAGGFKYGLAKAKINNKWGYINEKGKFVIQPKFERIGHQFRPVNARFESMYNYQLNY